MFGWNINYVGKEEIKRIRNHRRLMKQYKYTEEK